MTLSFDDLMEEAKVETEEKGLPFICKGGTRALFRPILMLSKQEMKNVLALVSTIQDNQDDAIAALEAMDNILLAVADRKDAVKKSLADLPSAQKAKIFESWMKAAEVPEA